MALTPMFFFGVLPSRGKKNVGILDGELWKF
jgi:hypothetical protein